MERKSVGFEQLSDIFGFRVIVKTLPDCYQALGIVHTTWPVVPGRFKDYISTPKQNDYRSIHTTVIGPSKQRVELQIRTTRDARDRRIRDRRARALQGRRRFADRDAVARIERLCLAAPDHRAAGGGLEPGGVPRAHQARAVPRPGVLLHPEGQADRAAARGERRSTSPMRCIPTSATWRSAARSTARSRRWSRSSSTATRSRSSPRRRRSRRRPPGNRSWSPPARRAPPSGAPPGLRCARNMPGSAAASSSGCASAPRSSIPTRSCRARCRGWRARSIEEVMAAVGRGEMRAADVVRAMYPDYKEERAAAIAQQPKPESGWFGLKKAQVGQSQSARGESGAAIPDPRHQQRLAGAVCAQRRRRAGRPHRRHPHAGRGHHHLSDPVARAAGIRGRTPERWLDLRWDVEERTPQRFPARDRGADR